MFRLTFPPETWQLFQIRAHLAYSELSYIHDPVERCEECKSKDEPEINNFVLQSFDGKGTHEVFQEHREHCSVVIKPEATYQPPNEDMIEANYKITCLSTCPTINRRKMKLVFTLEHREYVANVFS
jgi:P53 DNA-binding domain